MQQLQTPEKVLQMLPQTAHHREIIDKNRSTIQNLLCGKDPRVALVFGPCSIHDLSSAFEYARRFRALAEEVKESCFCVMRVYIEKPRTTAGWKGLVYDPHLDGSGDLQTGIFWARELFLTLTDLAIPIATEILNPMLIPFFSDLISWGFIGARTSASQTHRELASYLPFPIGFKNSTDGNVQQAVSAMVAALSSHRIPLLSPQGTLSAIDSVGNPWTHVVLRGSAMGPNYDPFTVAATTLLLHEHNFKRRILIDCSHGNCQKEAAAQKISFTAALEQALQGSSPVLGMMLESNLSGGVQSLSESPSTLQYGVSVTDPCLGWDETEGLIREAFSQLSLI